MRSPMTTLCYVEKDDSYLMMHRISKKNDVNKDKWIGIGGHFEPGESPEECLLREAFEETGLKLTKWRFRGLVTFVFESTEYNMEEYMCLYTSDGYEGDITDANGNMKECNEGVLCWVKKDKLSELNLWEGDKIFFKLLNDNHEFFSLKLKYTGDKLVEAVLDGTDITDNMEYRRI